MGRIFGRKVFLRLFCFFRNEVPTASGSIALKIFASGPPSASGIRQGGHPIVATAFGGTGGIWQAARSRHSAERLPDLEV